MKKYHNTRLFTLFSKLTHALKMRVSTLVYKLSKKKKLESLQNLSFNLPSTSKKMDIQIETIEIIDAEQGSNDVVIIKLSNPKMILESQDDLDIDPFEKKFNTALFPFPPSTRIH